MAVPPDEVQVELWLDYLKGQLQRGQKLEDALARAELMLGGNDEGRAALEEARRRLIARRNQIENLRRPKTIIKRGRESWYPGPSESDVFWPPLKTYLQGEKRWPERVIDSLDATSTKVISCLDFPGNPKFSSRGLVLGHVQSGKTANFTAVISKAADAGFRLFIVLSGLTNSLRQQTQVRLDEELVARHLGSWMTWTDASSDIGDIPFNVNALLNTDSKHLAVVKKNGARLRRMVRMIRDASQQIRRTVPVMIIDDECDQASVNAGGSPARVTAINQLLRDIISELPRVAYIGYTATPYANVLIDPGYPDDLYPRDFIVALPQPDAYFGAERLFGRDMLDADEVPPDEQGLDMIRLVPDDEAASLQPASRTQRTSFVPAMTSSLREAILYYAMASAAKVQRGLGDECSCMLIHTTVYADCHLAFEPIVSRFVAELRVALERKDPALTDELEQLWNTELGLVDSQALGCDPVSSGQVLERMPEVLASIEVVVENSISDRRLDFSEGGERYIVVGGNVLARGLTIEGLVTSFFLRTSSQYDSLMQMGRWFGYRRGYEDLPRIWMTAEMADYFRDMATVEAEIRRDIERYEEENITPLDFGIRIRLHPTLAVTARNKMIFARQSQMSYSDQHLQTRKFRRQNSTWLRSNWEAGARLVDAALNQGATVREKENHKIISDIPFKFIRTFLEAYQFHEAHADLQPARLIEYVDTQNRRDDGILSRWNLVVVGARGDRLSEEPLGTLGTVSTVIRARLKNTMEDVGDIKALMSKADIVIDLDPTPDTAQQGWDDLKQERAARRAPPLLLLYPIDRLSEPRLSTSEHRRALDAVGDVLAVGLLFPKANVDTPVGYVSAPIDLSRYEEAEYVEEELAEP